MGSIGVLFLCYQEKPWVSLLLLQGSSVAWSLDGWPWLLCGTVSLSAGVGTALGLLQKLLLPSLPLDLW